MMPIRCALIAGFVALSACGGSTAAPLISGSVTGSFKGTSFQVVTGFAKQVQGKGALIGLGDGQLTCASPDSANPPAGLTGILSLSSFAVGTYPGAPVTILKSDGNSLDAFGSSGDVAITAATASTSSGTVQFSAADGSNTDTLDGMFEVVLCN